MIKHDIHIIKNDINMTSIQQVHVYSAAGAFLAKICSNKHGKYEHVENKS